MFSRKVSFIVSSFVLLFILLTGCHSLPKQEEPEVTRSAKMVAFAQKLETSGARVIQTGQTLTIILPSDQLFMLHSANFIQVSSPILNTVSQMMAILETTSAQVSGYADTEPDMLRNKALSMRQAEIVADYLWSKGLDTRLLYTVGYGNQGGIFSELPGNLKENTNCRIEIRFQYLPLLSSLT